MLEQAVRDSETTPERPWNLGRTSRLQLFVELVSVLRDDVAWLAMNTVSSPGMPSHCSRSASSGYPRDDQLARRAAFCWEAGLLLSAVGCINRAYSTEPAPAATAPHLWTRRTSPSPPCRFSACPRALLRPHPGCPRLAARSPPKLQLPPSGTKPSRALGAHRSTATATAGWQLEDTRRRLKSARGSRLHLRLSLGRLRPARGGYLGIS